MVGKMMFEVPSNFIILWFKQSALHLGRCRAQIWEKTRNHDAFH